MPGYPPAEAGTCRRCGEEKPGAEFNPDPRMLNGLSSYCRPCRTEYGRGYRNVNRARVRELSRKRYANRTPDKIEKTKEYERSRGIARHGLTVEKYEELLTAQGGVCAICDAPEAGGKGSWHIDHDHRCCPGQFSCGGCIRGLLCHKCNTALGLIDNYAHWAARAAVYSKEGK